MKFIDLEKQYRLIEPEVLKAISRVLEHGQYIMGPEIALLEQQLAEFTGVRYAVANANGTDALVMCLMALGIGTGDEVITSAFSFFATAEAIILCGATPVFADIDPISYNLDPTQIAAYITPKTKAIMPVSLYGQCADMLAIEKIAKEHALPVIEDSAQSFGATQHGKASGSLSTLGTTSFFPAKPLGGYGDSGAIFTNDANLAEILCEIRIHGQSARYQHKRIGINGRMDTIQAAILLEKLKLFPDEVVLRQQIAQRYNDMLSGLVTIPQLDNGNTSVYAQYTIEVNKRDKVQENMHLRGIPTAVHYPIALHQQEALQYLGHQPGDFPQAENAAQRVLSLPMHPYLTEVEQLKVVQALRESLE